MEEIQISWRQTEHGNAATLIIGGENIGSDLSPQELRDKLAERGL